MNQQQSEKLVLRIHEAIVGGNQARANKLIERLSENRSLSVEVRAWRDTVFHLAGLLYQGLEIRPGAPVPRGWTPDGERNNFTATEELLSAAGAVATRWDARDDREAAERERQLRPAKKKKARAAAKAVRA